MLTIDQFSETMNWISDEVCRCDDDKRNTENNHRMSSTESIEEVIIANTRQTESMKCINHRIEHFVEHTVISNPCCDTTLEVSRSDEWRRKQTTDCSDTGCFSSRSNRVNYIPYAIRSLSFVRRTRSSRMITFRLDLISERGHKWNFSGGKNSIFFFCIVFVEYQFHRSVYYLPLHRARKQQENIE